MSQREVEVWRASIEDIRARISTGAFDREATSSKMAELSDSEIEWDTSEAEAGVDLQDEPQAARRSPTSWSMS
jgi:hypothetical protein